MDENNGLEKAVSRTLIYQGSRSPHAMLQVISTTAAAHCSLGAKRPVERGSCHALLLIPSSGQPETSEASGKGRRERELAVLMLRFDNCRLRLRCGEAGISASSEAQCNTAVPDHRTMTAGRDAVHEVQNMETPIRKAPMKGPCLALTIQPNSVPGERYPLSPPWLVHGGHLHSR